MKKSTHAIIHKTPFTWKINDLGQNHSLVFGGILIYHGELMGSW